MRGLRNNLRLSMNEFSASRRFCLLTVGRSGSTSLMNFLGSFSDIALPCKDVDCVDNELLHPDRVAAYAAAYARRCNRSVRTSNELIECFYAVQTAPYAGFKSMPNRHPDFATFATRGDIRFITLLREDVVSTVASFLVAMDTGSWRRSGEPQRARWTFNMQRDGRRVLGNLAYVQQCNAALRGVPRAIGLSYEELCSPDFGNAELDSFFGRKVRIENPRPPTHGGSYVENWEEFSAFVQNAISGRRQVYEQHQ